MLEQPFPFPALRKGGSRSKSTRRAFALIRERLPLIERVFLPISVRMNVEERRRKDRLLCAGLIEVRWNQGLGRTFATVANLFDLSSRGVGLVLECPLPPGTRVEFSQSGRRVSGEVRYCNPTELGWIAGVEFGPDSRWDPMACPPEHVLDPKSIPRGAVQRSGRQLSPGALSTIQLLVLNGAMRREEA